MTRRSFWRDFNVYLAALAIGVTFGGVLLHLPIAALAMLVLPASKAEAFALPAGYALLAGVLAWVWRRHGLSPAQVAPQRERRFRIGHALLAAGNAGAALIMAQALLGAWIVTQPALLPLLRAALAVTLLAPLAMAAGLWMVFTSRAPKAQDPGFADTVPARAAARPYLPIPARTSGANWAAVLAGIVVSAGMGFMIAVFGVLSFQDRVDQYMSVAVPVFGAVFVVYLASALWLAGSGHGAVAVRVAWAPPVLLIGASMVFTILSMVAMTLFR